ncbi:MAG TPA: hypothetical protein VG273_28135, partial [Bryobacteraceae bacterium]|nr:hypothetical protein [Bryobacteraceae bacterium]
VYQDLGERISQGDIIEILPHLYLEPPLAAVVESDTEKLYELHTHPHPALQKSGQDVVAKCSQKLAVVLTADCELDKSSRKKWIICPIVSLSSVGGVTADVKKNRTVRFFFLPRCRELFDDSVAVLDQLTTVDRSFIEAGKRLITLSDIGRFGLYAQYIRWLTRWEFKNVKCPTCGTEFDPTLGMSVRSPDEPGK